MNSEARSRSEELVDELSDLDQRSDREPDNVSLLKGMRDGLQQLFDTTDGNAEAIRSLLEASRDRGELRQESFELVTSMLDNYVTERQPTLGGGTSDDDPDRVTSSEDESDDEFASTMVLSDAAFEPDRPDRRLQVGSVLRDRFLLQEQVPGGSMGIVYKALDRRLAETGADKPYVAVKVISPVLAKNARALRALQQEAAKGRCLTHNHIARFLDFDREDDLHFIVMEWLDGENLADLLDRGEAIDAKRALKITRQIGQALDYAHRCGIVHADIKPANVMIMPDGDAKLFDFGVARARQSAERSGEAPSGLGAMTPAYSSMQVLTGEEPAPEDDVFSLACLYYRLVAGYRVFGPRNAAEAAQEGMSPQPLQGISDGQWKAVKKALSFARVTRFSTVAKFLDALTPEEGAETISADPGSRIELEPDLPGSSKGSWLAFFVVILLAGAAAWYGGFIDPYLDRVGLGGKSQPAPIASEPGSRPLEGGPVDASNESLSEAGTFKPRSNGAEMEPEPPVDTPASVEANAASTPEQSTADVPPPSIKQFEDLSTDIEVVPAQESVAVEPVALPELPLGDLGLLLEPGGSAAFVLEESAGAVRLDVVRTSGVDVSERVAIEVLEYSGNRSPIESGELVLSPSSELVFAAGAERVQVELTTRDDPLREADQTVTLLFRSESGVESIAEIQLRDDDQRRFEASLPANTVAFAAGQVSVDEQDAAVQLDVVRFRPDDQALMIFYTVSDVTATADADYFPPADTTVEFAPGQRLARILVPLVQDSEPEGNEAFVLELVSGNEISDAEIYQRIAVMIRDDD